MAIAAGRWQRKLLLGVEITHPGPQRGDKPTIGKHSTVGALGCDTIDLSVRFRNMRDGFAGQESETGDSNNHRADKERNFG